MQILTRDRRFASQASMLVLPHSLVLMPFQSLKKWQESHFLLSYREDPHHTLGDT